MTANACKVPHILIESRLHARRWISQPDHCRTTVTCLQTSVRFWSLCAGPFGWGACVGAFCAILHDKVDFDRRILATRRLLDSPPVRYRLLAGHGKGPWDDIGGAPKHTLTHRPRFRWRHPPSGPHLTFDPSLISHLAPSSTRGLSPCGDDLSTPMASTTEWQLP